MEQSLSPASRMPSSVNPTGAAAVEAPGSVWESHAVTHEVRVRRALAVAGLLVALVFAVPRVMTHTPYARLGVSLQWTEQGHARVDRVVGPPSEGILRPGDLLLTMNGEPFALTPSVSIYARPQLPREEITFGVLRGGEKIELVIPPARVSIWQRIRYLMLPLSAVVAGPLVAMALVWRRPDLGTAWVFLWFAALQALGVVHQIYRFPEVEPAGAFRVFMGIYAGLVCWVPASFLHLMTVFPRPRWRPGERWKSAWSWLVAVAYLVPLYFVGRLIVNGSVPEQTFLGYETAALVLGVGLLVERYSRRGAEWNRSRLQMSLAFVTAFLLLFGGALGWLIEDERGAALLQLPLLRVLIPSLGIAVLFTPFLMAVLIARDPVFDPRRWLERTLPYALVSGMIAATYLALVVLGERLFAAVTGERAVIFNLTAALVVAFVFSPLRERVQRVIDRFFRRDQIALRAALDRAARDLLGALDRREVRVAVESAIARGVGRPVEIVWPEGAPPRIAETEDLWEDARHAVEILLMQAGIRLENLALQAHRATAERNAVELREAAIRAELRALHAKVQPHFLFNALNALSYLIETEPPAAQRFTERLADMLRYTVEAGNRHATLLSEEIGFVEDYLGVARERYEGELTFSYRGERELLSAAVPPLLLQPLVENSLKHGFSPERPGLQLALDARREDGWLSLTFSDDGLASNGSRGFGVGLENLQQRLRRFAGPEAQLNSGPRPEGGFAVRLRWREAAAQRGASAAPVGDPSPTSGPSPTPEPGA